MMTRFLSRSFIKFAAIGIMFFLSAGCVKNEIAVEIELPENVDDAYKMTYYASDPVKGWFVETVAAVQRGKVKMKLITRNPTIVYVMDAGSMPRAAFYAERGDKITIKGDSREPSSWDIKGNKLTEEWSRWRLDNRAAIASGEPSGINKAVGDYVRSNPDRPLSTLLLLIYYDRRVDDSGFHKLWGMLRDKALEPKWMQLVSRSDMLRDAPLAVHKVDSLLLHTYGNGVDTLRIGSKPMLLYFWRERDGARNDGMDVVKKIAKDFPDSVSRVLADICFDPDSTGWRSAVRRDSLAKVVRGWSFHGEADSVMMRMGVERTPWFIVFDGAGKEVYAGDKPSNADNAFRKTIVKK